MESTSNPEQYWDEVWKYYTHLEKGGKLSGLGYNNFAFALREAEAAFKEKSLETYIKLRIKERNRRRKDMKEKRKEMRSESKR